MYGYIIHRTTNLLDTWHFRYLKVVNRIKLKYFQLDNQIEEEV